MPEVLNSFTSNMSLMTREIATYLAQVPNLYIMASIDGPRTVHDAYRVYANDAPTFEDSIGGLRILADAYAGSHMPVNINAVLTPPFGFEKLEQVNAYFESLDWLPATCHVNITYPSYGTCPGLDEYYDKITGNPKYALHGMCNPLMIWQQRKAETDGLDAYKARNIYYHSIFDDLVKINNRIMLLWLAGLETIPRPLYEAAAVDGATPFQTFVFITLPNLLPTVVLTTILSLVNSFKVFREAYLVAGNYPQESIYLLQHLFNNWFLSLDIGKLSAAAVLLALGLGCVVYLLYHFWGGGQE